MDGARFDRLVALFAARVGRRSALGLLAALGLGNSPLAEGDARARKKPKPKPCGPCKRRVKGKCKPKPAGSPCPGGTCRGGACATGGTSPPPPPAPQCPQAAAPNFCASANACVPACPAGKLFDAASCECRCADRTCCSCLGGSNPFCSGEFASNQACMDACAVRNPNGLRPAWFGGNGNAGVCSPDGCSFSCRQDACAGADACIGSAGSCPLGGQCLQPLGGGPTRCGTSTGLCGCASHAACEGFGPGAFCAQITGPNCTCGAGQTTFCALPGAG